MSVGFTHTVLSFPPPPCFIISRQLLPTKDGACFVWGATTTWWVKKISYVQRIWCVLCWWKEELPSWPSLLPIFRDLNTSLWRAFARREALGMPKFTCEKHVIYMLTVCVLPAQRELQGNRTSHRAPSSIKVLLMANKCGTTTVAKTAIRKEEEKKSNPFSTNCKALLFFCCVFFSFIFDSFISIGRIVGLKKRSNDKTRWQERPPAVCHGGFNFTDWPWETRGFTFQPNQSWGHDPSHCYALCVLWIVALCCCIMNELWLPIAFNGPVVYLQTKREWLAQEFLSLVISGACTRRVVTKSHWHSGFFALCFIF